MMRKHSSSSHLPQGRGTSPTPRHSSPVESDDSQRATLESGHDNPVIDVELTIDELAWQMMYHILQHFGYRLRPRYDPNFPGPRRGEHGIRVDGRCAVMDATRISDGAQVALKMDVEPGTPEFTIFRRVWSEPLRSNPRNRCIPLLDLFEAPAPVPNSETVWFAAFPLARDWRSPAFVVADEVIPFIQDLLEGLVFLHENNIAHRDIKANNIMMDPSSMYPHGMNPLANYTLNSLYRVPEPPSYNRIDHPARYWYIDFDLSICFDSKEDRKLIQWEAGSKAAPEIWTWFDEDCEDVDGKPFEIKTEGLPERPYDPFKADVYVLGWLFVRYFWDALPSLRNFFMKMIFSFPKDRPDAEESLRLFHACMYKVSVRDLVVRIEDNPYLLDCTNGWDENSLTVLGLVDDLTYTRTVVKVLFKYFGRGNSRLDLDFIPARIVEETEDGSS